MHRIFGSPVLVASDLTTALSTARVQIDPLVIQGLRRVKVEVRA